MHIKNSAHLFNMVGQISIFFHHFTLEAFQCLNMSQPLWLDERVSDIYKSLAYHCERQASYLFDKSRRPLCGVSIECTNKHCQTVNQQDGCFSVLHRLFGCCTPAQRPLNQTTQGLLSTFCSSKTTVIKFPTVYVLQKGV